MLKTTEWKCRTEEDRAADMAEHTKSLAMTIYDTSYRWATRDEPLFVLEDRVHGAVWSALMELSREKAEAEGKLPTAKQAFEFYEDIRNKTRIEHFNTIRQNYMTLFT